MAKHRLANLELTKKEAKDKLEPSPSDRPKFPFGLTVHLDEDTVSKLDMKEMPKVGAKMSLIAVVNVESVSESETQGSKKNRSIQLQITDMALVKEEDPRDAVDVLYPEDKS